MPDESAPLVAERRFFAALLASDVTTLDHLLTDDFLLVDVMSGSEIDKPALLAVVASGQLKFEAIEVLDSRERRHQNTSIITGSTRMRGNFGGQSFAAHSRYTHVFIDDGGSWKFVSAQGTPIAAS